MSLAIGITNTSFNVYGSDERYAVIKRCGYDSIDFQEFANIYTDFFKLPEEQFLDEVRAQRDKIESYGLKVHQAHAPWVGNEPRDRTPEERSLWLAAMKKALKGVSVLGSRLMVVHALCPYDDSDKNSDEVIELNEKFLAGVADFAAEYGITVCLENLPFKKHPLSSVQAVCDVVDKLNRDNLKVCLDTGHAAIFDPDVAFAVRYIGHRLATLHIHDNMGDADSHLIPGDGIIDWDAFAKALKDIGYTGVISLETSPKHGQFPKEQWKAREELLAKIAADIAKKAN